MHHKYLLRFLSMLVLSIMILSWVAAPASAQGGQPPVTPGVPPGEPPVGGPDIHHDVSPPLHDIPPIEPPGPPEEVREWLEFLQTRHMQPGPQVADPVLQGSLIGPAAPAAANNFDGVPNIDGVYPPDTNGDVGPNHYVQMVNLHFQIWDKSGNSLYGPAASNTLWSGFGGPCETRNDGDPIVLYDPLADRWVMSQFTAANPYGECVAVSTTGDPTGTWYRYFFQFSTTVFYDYPKLGVWPDGYYLSANRFGTISFQGASAIVLDRAKMLNGQPATFQQFNTSTSYGTLLPADLDGATLPPTGAPATFAEIGSSALHLWKFHVDWTTPANSTFTGPATLTAASYNQLCPLTRSCVPQPGTSVGLDGLGDRLMHRLAYRNFSDHESLVVAHNVNAASSGTQAGVRWYEIRNPSTTPTLYQQGTFAPDTTHRWMGSVAMDQSGNIALGYSVSSSSVYPGIRYTGRLAGDPLGQMTQGETSLIAGSGSQTGSGSRWGDYAMMAVDPVDDCTFWFTTEYMPSTGTAPWRTRIGSFKFPSCGGVIPTATPTSTNTPIPGPTSTATSTPTNTPIPVLTNTPTRTPTSIPTNTFTPAPSQELIVNGGFEGGTSPWVLSGDAYYSTGGYAHSGTGYMILGYYNYASGTLYQTVTIPSNASSANLTFWLNVTSSETTTTTKYDFLYIEVRNTSGTLLQTLTSYSNLDKGTLGVYSQKGTFNLLAYKGQTIRMQFRATTDFSLPTAFRVDDVSVK